MIGEPNWKVRSVGICTQLTFHFVLEKTILRDSLTVERFRRESFRTVSVFDRVSAGEEEAMNR